jgi:hypothetical protein
MAKKLIKKKVKPPKKAKKTDIKANAGKVFVNLGQVIFGTFFLGGMLRGDISQIQMILSGIIAAAILIIVGLLLSAKEIKDDEE